MRKFRNIRTGTVYDDVKFNETSIAEVLHNGQWYTVKESQLEEAVVMSKDSSLDQDSIKSSIRDWIREPKGKQLTIPYVLIRENMPIHFGDITFTPTKTGWQHIIEQQALYNTEDGVSNE